MRLRTSLYLLALLFLFGCSGGGTSSAGGGMPAPPPGPQLVSMKLDVEVPDQAQRAIQGRSAIFEVVVEVVDRNTLDPGTLSGRKILSRGAASVGDTDQTVRILLDVIPGIWDVYIFGLDSDGRVAGLATIEQLAIFAGTVFEQKINLQPVSQGVFVTPSSTAVPVGGTAQFTAIVVLPLGTNTSVTWSSDNPAVARVDANGLATGLAPGQALIRATSTVDNSLQGTGVLNVTPPNVTVQSVNLALTPASPVRLGQPGLQFNANAIFSDGSSQPITPDQFVSSDPTVLSVDSVGGAQALNVGSSDVTADFMGVTSAPVPVDVEASRVVVVESEPGPDEIFSYLLDEGTGSLVQVDVETIPNGVGAGLGADLDSDAVFVSQINDTLAVYLVSALGILSQSQIIGLAGTPTLVPATGAGGFLYLADNNPTPPDLRTYAFDGALYNLVGLSNPAGVAEVQVMAAKNGIPALYLADFLASVLNGLVLTGSTPDAVGTQVGGSPLPLLTQPRRLEIHPSNNFLVVGRTGNVDVFPIDAAGNITGPAISSRVTAGTGLTALAIHPSGNFVATCTLQAGGVIEIFPINASGILSPPVATVSSSSQIWGLGFNAPGNFLIYPELTNNQIVVQRFDPNTGALTPATISVAINRPFEMVVFP
ncbi:hypothetical protein DYH09_07315 [bacterium CPR1]|nr:hypothetical protein [bacterium CPR1]